MGLKNIQYITRSLSEERLHRYLAVSLAGPAEAIKLYEFNCRVSEAFYTPLEGFEICLRNHLNLSLIGRFGQDWLQDERVRLDEKARQKIATAILRLTSRRKAATNAQLVAELSLGFWVSLLTKRYDTRLWRECLHLCFRSEGAPLRRFAIHERCHRILEFRNRIAHHEPIWDQDLIGRYREIIEAIGWMCGDTALWVERRSRLPVVILDQ